MMFLTTVLFVFIGIISTAYLFLKKKHAYWKERGVPHLEPENIYGSKRTSIRSHLAKYYSKRGTFPFIGGYNLLTPLIVATDLDFVRNVLVTNFSYFTDHGLFSNTEDDPLTASLFNLEGQKWKSMRTKLSPTFTSGRMKFMFPTVIEVAEKFINVLNDILKIEATLEVKDLLARFTTDVIGTCAFGIECNSLKNPNVEFRKYGRKHLEVMRNGMLKMKIMSAFPKLARKLHFKQVHDDVTEFFMGIVRQTVEYREKNNIRRNDFMDLLIQLKNNAKLEGTETDAASKALEHLTFEELAAQAFVFFVGGFETSSSTMTFTLYELAYNQQIQEKCRAEIKAALDKHNNHFTYDAMVDLKYIEQVILETLRKYPILPMIFRKCVQDYTVPGTSVTIEKGKPIQIPVFEIHRDPEYYPDPDKFDPDRFSPENVRSRHPMTFLGFGDGPRNCIGLRFGKMQSMIGLIMLLKNYRIQLSAKTPVPLILSKKGFLTAPEGGMYLDFEKL